MQHLRPNFPPFQLHRTSFRRHQRQDHSDRRHGPSKSGTKAQSTSVLIPQSLGTDLCQELFAQPELTLESDKHFPLYLSVTQGRIDCGLANAHRRIRERHGAVCAQSGGDLSPLDLTVF
jgi:hypothetical protein